MKKLLLLFVALPTLAFAQDGGQLPGGFLGELIVFVLGAAFLTFVGQQLRRLNISLPDWLKPLLPVAFGLLAGFISDTFGILPDFGPILGALLGTTSAFLFDTGKELGFLKSSTG